MRLSTLLTTISLSLATLAVALPQISPPWYLTCQNTGGIDNGEGGRDSCTSNQGATGRIIQCNNDESGCTDTGNSCGPGMPCYITGSSGANAVACC
jgi:hypothetical protein